MQCLQIPLLTHLLIVVLILLRNMSLTVWTLTGNIPALIGDNNKFRPEDKQGYTLLFKELRQGLDSLKKITRKNYLVTTAVGGS